MSGSDATIAAKKVERFAISEIAMTSVPVIAALMSSWGIFNLASPMEVGLRRLGTRSRT